MEDGIAKGVECWLSGKAIGKGVELAGSALKKAPGEVAPRATTAAERAAEGALAKRTCTIWDKIKPTQPFYPNTKIPKSFEIHLENGKFWVHPNATEHMAEYISRKLSHGIPVNSQILLTDFSNAVSLAIKDKLIYDTTVRIGSWEFRFGAPRNSGLLPSIYHALYQP